MFFLLVSKFGGEKHKVAAITVYFDSAHNASVTGPSEILYPEFFVITNEISFQQLTSELLSVFYNIDLCNYFYRKWQNNMFLMYVESYYADVKCFCDKS